MGVSFYLGRDPLFFYLLATLLSPRVDFEILLCVCSDFLAMLINDLSCSISF